jgi:hypothetical protein
MSTLNIFADTFGTPHSWPFKIFADDDGNHQDLSGTTVTIQWENETTGETGQLTGAVLTIVETTALYKRYKATYTFADNDLTDEGLYNFKVRLTKTGLKKEIGLFKANVRIFT